MRFLFEVALRVEGKYALTIVERICGDFAIKGNPGLDEGTYTKLQPGKRDLVVQESSTHRCDLKADDDHAIQQAAMVTPVHQHEWTAVICLSFRIESKIASCSL